MKFDRHLGSAAAEVSVKVQSALKSLIPNLLAARLQEILWQDTRPLSEEGPEFQAKNSGYSVKINGNLCLTVWWFFNSTASRHKVLVDIAQRQSTWAQPWFAGNESDYWLRFHKHYGKLIERYSELWDCLGICHFKQECFCYQGIYYAYVVLICLRIFLTLNEMTSLPFVIDWNITCFLTLISAPFLC